MRRGAAALLPPILWGAPYEWRIKLRSAEKRTQYMAQPPHKRFQIHLSTTIWLSLAMGGIIWANTRVTRAENGYLGSFEYYGWPLESYVVWGQLPLPVFPLWGLAADLAVAIAILFAVWRISEWCVGGTKETMAAGAPLPKRFQIHLSTAIWMSFSAGGLIWANTIPYFLGRGGRKYFGFPAWFLEIKMFFAPLR